MHARQMMSTHLELRGSADDSFVRRVENCYDCSQTCTACADVCMAAG